MARLDWRSALLRNSIQDLAGGRLDQGKAEVAGAAERGMLCHDSLLNGIALSRVTNERSATSPGPHLFTGLHEHHLRSGLGSRARHNCAATRSRSA